MSKKIWTWLLAGVVVVESILLVFAHSSQQENERLQWENNLLKDTIATLQKEQEEAVSEIPEETEEDPTIRINDLNTRATLLENDQYAVSLRRVTYSTSTHILSLTLAVDNYTQQDIYAGIIDCRFGKYGVTQRFVDNSEHILPYSSSIVTEELDLNDLNQYQEADWEILYGNLAIFLQDPQKEQPGKLVLKVPIEIEKSIFM